MKTLQAEAGLRHRTRKTSTQDTDFNRCNQPQWTAPFARTDGSVGVDKTIGLHSRKGKKQAIRNANRSIQKRGRTALKRQLNDELEAALLYAGRPDSSFTQGL